LGVALAQRLCGRPSVVISTCHRVEVYVDPAQGWRDLGDQMPAGSRLLTDDDAVRHLFSVAVGLDSAVLGEDEVLHQVRQGVEAGRSNAPLSPVLERLFQEALRTGRRARAERPERPISLAEAALTRVMPLGERAGRSVLVVGAGAMGKRAARAARLRGARLFVTSRRPERAAALADATEAEVVPFDPWSQLPHRIDLVVIALAGRGPSRLAASRQWTNPAPP